MSTLLFLIFLCLPSYAPLIPTFSLSGQTCVREGEVFVYVSVCVSWNVHVRLYSKLTSSWILFRVCVIACRSHLLSDLFIVSNTTLKPIWNISYQTFPSELHFRGRYFTRIIWYCCWYLLSKLTLQLCPLLTAWSMKIKMHSIPYFVILLDPWKFSAFRLMLLKFEQKTINKVRITMSLVYSSDRKMKVCSFFSHLVTLVV